MSIRSMVTRTGVVSLGLALALSGCGGSPTGKSGSSGTDKAAPKDTAATKLYAEIGGLTGKARRDKLVGLAEKEGELSLYTSMTSDVVDAVTEAFSNTYKVDVTLYRAGSETVLQRVLQEQKAGFRGNDVVETNANEMFAMVKEGALADYKGERRDLVPEATGRFDGWTATRFNLFTPSWNTKLVKPGEQPKSWEELADPKWDGKMSMEVGDYDWYLTLYEYWQKKGKSTAEIDKLFADMADGAKIAKGHTVQGELMSAGQFAVTASNYSYLVEQLKRTGAPVAYAPFVQPVIARPNGIGLMKSAKHPAAAMLFTDWMLEEGQKVLSDLGLTPSIPQGGTDPLKGLEVIPIDLKTLVEKGDVWSKKYEQVVAGGEKVAD
jgi:iron(III) transport system substrate-binding protein